MQFGKSTKQLFFSVTYTTDVGQARCIPQVCYKLNEDIRATVEKMAEDGLAKIYQEEMRFISGVALPLKKRKTDAVKVSSAWVSSSASQEKPDALVEEELDVLVEEDDDRDFD